MHLNNIHIPSKRLSRLRTRRKVWLSLHLWLGLTLGFLLSIYGITGSLLVFHAEIDEWLNPALLTVKPDSSAFKPLADIFVAGNESMPEQAKLSFATYPRNEQAAFKLNYALPLTDDIVENRLVAVDPYTAQVLGSLTPALSRREREIQSVRYATFTVTPWGVVIVLIGIQNISSFKSLYTMKCRNTYVISHSLNSFPDALIRRRRIMRILAHILP